MAYENLCMYCFKDLGGDYICPHCGKDSRAAVPQIQMLPGTTVYRGRFLLGRALGQDASGIVYTAMDTKRGGTIRIREYLPRNSAERLNDGTVVPLAGMEDAFESGMRKLRASVDGVEDPHKRHFFFEENGTAYVAQRKNSGGRAPEPEYVDDEEDAADHRKQIILYIAIAAAVVLAVAIGLIWFLNSMGDTDDVTLVNPLSTTSPGATWMPAETPTPTPYATATFAALVDPELSWMDYTYSGNVNDDYQQQVNASATKKPVVFEEEDYHTINSNSSSKNVKALQERLVRLGWMQPSQVNGKYDSATKAAVKAFQNYVNEYCSPAKKLTVDGIAGEKTQQWLYNSSVSLVKPTPTPTPLVTPEPNGAVVDKNSSAKEIRSMQKKLIALGMLPEGSADGEYGSSTATAVKNFQIRVNQILKYDALEVNGVMNAETMAYLNYYVEWWAQMQQATATPPAATATPEPTRDPNAPIDASAPREQIAFVQEMLNQVGLMDLSGIDGVYGSGTIAAVKNFQNWVNELRNEETLAVTGVCDALTLRYLEYCIETGRVVQQPTQEPELPTQAPTEAPTEAPTAEPDPTQVPEYGPDEGEGETDGGDSTIDPSSPAESISYVQEMLSEIGLMDPSGVDGDYGEMTKTAIRELQQFVNDQKGENVLEVTGICDPDTLQYLMYCYDRGINITDQGDAPDAPDEPEADAPEEEPEVPEEEPVAGGITPDSPRESISFMQEMLSEVGLMDPSGVDGDYGAGTAEAISALQQFVNDQKGERVLEVNGLCDEMTLKYLQYCYEQGWNLEDSGDAPDAEPTQSPVDEPEEDIEQEPEEEPTPEPTEEPAPEVGTIEYLSVSIDGLENDGDLFELNPGSYTITWNAEGDLDSYYLYLFDGEHNLLKSAEGTSNSSFSLNTDSMQQGMIYELRIGALPLNGTQDDIQWQSIQMMLPVQATPEPTAEPTPEPTAKPSVSAPAINIGSSVYQEDGVTYINDSTVIFSWMAEGQVESYTVNLLYQDGTEFSLGTVTDTSKSVPIEQLQPGLYKLYVGATPVDGSDEDTVWSELRFGVPAPEPTEEPEPDPTEEPEIETEDARITYIDANSSADDIQTVQMALYKYGLLNADEIEPGSLDEGTLQAVAAFQQKLNETLGINLYVIDPSLDVFIDTETLDYLLYQTLDF